MRSEYTKENTTSERMTLKGEDNKLDKDFLEALTTGSGPLVHGALPAMDVQQEKSLAEALTGGNAAKTKKNKAKSTDPEAERVEPATLKEYLVFAKKT